jgi:CheY-like chemotaxis protein
LGLTQVELATLLELSHQQVQRYESGENTISMVRALEIAQCLNVKLEYLYESAPLIKSTRQKSANGIIAKDASRPLKLLVVDDTSSDEMLFRKAVEKSSVAAEVDAIQFPQSVMNHLTNETTGLEGDLPDIIILDINMPRMSGLQLLKKIKSKPTLKYIPVIMLTHSVRSEDMLEAYANGASGFAQKNADLVEFYKDIDLLLQYWTRVIVLPSAA